MKFFTTTQLSPNISETPEGYLVCMGVSVARTGEQIYGVGETPIQPDPDGKVIVRRDAKEVFRPETIASFEGKPFTLQHPDVFVNPSNWSQLARGIVQNVRRGSGEQENDLVADLLVTDKTAIEAIRSGLREVSCGYEAEYVETGVGRGEQINIIGNHIALVEEGRAGAAYAINDHKGKGSNMTIKERIQALFSKASEDAVKLIETKDEASPKEEKKEEAKDIQTAPTQASASVAMGGDNASSMSIMDRLAKIEDYINKCMAKDAEAEAEKLKAAEKKEEAATAGDEEVVGEEKEMSDEDMMTDEEGYEGDEEEKKEEKKTADSAAAVVTDSATIARAEILAPGVEISEGNLKARALKAAYETTDGKKVIHQFTDGKEIDFSKPEQVDMIFVGASELLKTSRSTALAKTKTVDFSQTSFARKGVMTPEELNKKYADMYAK